MPSQMSAGEYETIVCHGPKAEYVPAALIAAVAAQGTVAGTSSWNSPLYTADGFYDFSIGVTLSQAGSVVLIRYIDDAGTVSLDAGQSQTLTAATAAVLVVTDGKPFRTYKLQINNSSGSVGAISAFAALASAH